MSSSRRMHTQVKQLSRDYYKASENWTDIVAQIERLLTALLGLQDIAAVLESPKAAKGTSSISSLSGLQFLLAPMRGKIIADKEALYVQLRNFL
jgi:hypothetical protein